MTNDERIISYFDNEMTAEEKISFERELRTSAELRSEFEKYLSIMKATERLKDIKLSQGYLNSILSEFRMKNQKHSSAIIKRNLGLAFGVMITFILSIFLVKFFISNGNGNIDVLEFTNSLNEDQRLTILNELNGDAGIENLIVNDLSEDELTDIFYSQLEVNNSMAEAYDIGYTDIAVALNQDEVQEIYDQILSLNF